MATKGKTGGSFKPLPTGTLVDFRYRSAHPTGTIAGVAKRGSTAKSTMYDVRPSAKDRHPGEPATVHRHGDKVHRRSGK